MGDNSPCVRPTKNWFPYKDDFGWWFGSKSLCSCFFNAEELILFAQVESLVASSNNFVSQFGIFMDMLEIGVLGVSNIFY